MCVNTVTVSFLLTTTLRLLDLISNAVIVTNRPFYSLPPFQLRLWKNWKLHPNQRILKPVLKRSQKRNLRTPGMTSLNGVDHPVPPGVVPVRRVQERKKLAPQSHLQRKMGVRPRRRKLVGV
tara:strand:+ start:137 stop:502 length:366 start_codon:yes stop_codon:yes gene_type:complete